MKWINKLICKIWGHDWIFPRKLMSIRRIKPSDYECRRCGITKDKVDNKLMMENLLEEGKK